jgi:anti-sigma regulatory factor (Ser/Thr protein kinase)
MEIKREDILILTIETDADVGTCRRKAVNIAAKIGFDEIKTGEVAILVSELVTNVLKHGGGKGKLQVSKIGGKNGKTGIEIVCCDGGTGIANLDIAIDDGYTEKQSLGIGLGTIRRFSDVFELTTADDPGVDFGKGLDHCLRIVKWLPENIWKRTNRKLITGAHSRSKQGELLNGDTYIIAQLNPDKTLAAVIDGLGHGKEAHLASNLIKEQILINSELNTEDLILNAHKAAKGTRGAVIGLIMIDTSASKLSFVGIGNIEGFILSPAGKKNLISYGGILGHSIRSPRTFEFPFNPGDTVCLYSDGIIARWNTNDIDWNEHPQKIADYLVNQFSRPNDDTTVLIINYTI